MTVTFHLHTHQLGYYGQTMRYAVHPGSVEVLVGNSSQQLPFSGCFQITGSPTEVTGSEKEVSKVFFSQVSLK
jgi:beta-glucosidase